MDSCEYGSRAPYAVHLRVRLPALLTNVRFGWKMLAATNTLAYYTGASTTWEKAGVLGSISQNFFGLNLHILFGKLDHFIAMKQILCVNKEVQLSKKRE
jgi:hypothetical protein